ncbi:MAG: helix-turn-helix domain-containing protein [Treponema sp.]|uniref:helix-turn-helix transcriptional regulator n=1 Tax=Treponema sp. TaxID=166 RepID=UPI0025D1C914|nr:response regulator transcription factor [Treponema sp.]MBQ8678858.1 helix-turn-helix domain-containing protein [Treponema sp.]
MEIQKELAKVEFKNREYLVNHISYDREMAFYQAIGSGNMEEMKRLFMPLNVEGFGKLSDNPLRNLKYHLIITVAMITRYVIESGLEMEAAYNLSDIYIQKIDVCNSSEEIRKIHEELCEAYVRRMQDHKQRKLYSKPVSQCIDFIYNNLHEKITLEDLAEASSMSSSYISKIFHAEVGITIAQYVQKKRVEAAKNLLSITDYSVSDISNYLQFSTESYFISVLRKFCGITPKKYREVHYRANLPRKEN